MSISVHEDLALDEPVLIEGLPGVGLVGKIAVDHAVDTLDMTYFGSVSCEGLPQVAVYRKDERGVLPPVRLYADEERNIVALQSDVPVSPSRSPEFADCVTGWIEDNGATPLYLSGMPREKQADRVPKLYGVATGQAGRRLDDLDVGLPTEAGAVSGPTGALLSETGERGLDAVGLIVESDPQFPDPEAARVLITDGINPLAGIEVDTESLVEQAEQIREQKEQLATRMQQADEDESSAAKPLRMFQ